jgi:5-methylthioadenosine/S-adenosylhomocysteine deaminase
MALLQKALHGPEVVSANQALRMATIGGARALGLEKQIGSLEVGKRADAIVVNLKSLHAIPQATDLVSAVVYSAQTADVKSVLVDGAVLMKDRELLTLNEQTVLEDATREGADLLVRAGIQS